MSLMSRGTEHRTRPGAMERKAKKLLFFAEFLRSPMQLGAWFSSPPRVAKALASNLGLEKAQAVAEFGPGTGPVTREILRLIPPGCKFFAVEKNERLASEFRHRFPQVKLFEDTAGNVAEHCREMGIEKLDALVTSLPWILFPRELQDQMFASAVATLKPGGRMSMITYRSEMMPMVRRMLDVVRGHFREVEPVRIVWSRMSPAYIYRCTK